MRIQGRTISGNRIALVSAALLVSGILFVWGSIRADTTVPQDDSGAMGDRVLEAKNGGVPAPVVRRRARVREAIDASTQASWAGEYFEGDGLGANITLSIAPNAGVAATWFGCMGLYGSDEGDIEERADGALVFDFKNAGRDVDAPVAFAFPTTLRPVRWGQRRYLLADDQMLDFVNAMHHGREPRAERHGFFLLAMDDEKKPVSGLPDLPDGVLASFRSLPLVVDVLSIDRAESIGESDFPRCRVRVRFRIPDGESVVPGLEFDVTEPPGKYATFQVVEVAGQDVVAEETLYDDCRDTENLPNATWVLSTGSYVAK